MNSKIIGIIIAVVIIAAGGWYFTQNKTNNQTKGQNEQTGAMSTTSSSLKDLLALGKSQKCTFSVNTEDQNSSGTFYIAGGKSRGMITAQANGTNINSNILYDGDTSYMWQEGTNTGFKFKVNEQEAKDAQTQAQGNIDPNQKFDMQCEGWSADDSMFVVPNNINFQDFSSVMPQTPSTSANVDNQNNVDVNPADICAQLPEPAKSSCEASMKKQ